VTRSSPFSGRADRSSSSTVTFWISASFGIFIASGCSRLLRDGRDELDALEPAARGVLDRHVVDRQRLALDALWMRERDRHRLAGPRAVLGAKTPSSMRETGGRFEAAHDQTGCSGAATPRTRGGLPAP
jgi:hypothetical protein